MELIAQEPVPADPTVARRRRRRSVPWVSAAILAVLLVLALIGPYITPADPLQNDLANQLQRPILFGGTWSRPLGTDYYGRDILSRIIAGARVTAFVSFISVILAAVFGTLLGMIAGYTRRRWLDQIISRLADLTLSFPIILLGLLLAVQLGPSYVNVIIVLSLLLWSRFAKLARAEVISWRTRDFVALSEVSGGGGTWIMRKHMLPNITNSLLVLATLQLGWAVLAEASLSFLGAGVPPPEPAWGSMVAEGQELLRTSWWVSTIPGIAIVLVVMALNLFGDWVRDRLDPQLRSL